MKTKVGHRKKLLGIFFIGITSGLPFPLAQSTMIIRLKESGISNELIGLLSLLSLPYVLKPLWSPLVDLYAAPLLSKYFSLRKGWLAFTQLLLLLLIILLGIISPADQLLLFICLTLALAFCSATQDLVVDAYRIEVLPPEALANGVANTLLGYRLGLLIATGAILFIAELSNWTWAYWGVALALLLAGLAGLGLIQQPLSEATHSSTIAFWKNIKLRIWTPLLSFLNKGGGWLVLFLIFFFKVPDHFLKVMNDVFFLEAGFDKIEIASVGKVYGIICSIIGLYLGALIVNRLKLKWAIWIALILQPLTNLILFLELYVEHSTRSLLTMVTVEQLGVGISSSILVTFLSQITDRQFAATHYAILSSITGLGAIHLSMPAGYIAERWGWPAFVLCSVLTAIPAILIYFQLIRRKQLQHFLPQE